MPGDEPMREFRVRARFGLPMQHDRNPFRARQAELDAAARSLDTRLAPGGIALVTGPSGSGKSVVLRAFAACTCSATVTPISTSAKRAPLALIRRDLDVTLALLLAVGLGEARRLVTPAGLLSEGERARLALARALAHARGGDIVCDEFASALDRLTARSLCRCVRRAVAPTQRLVVATAHDEIATLLDPDLLLYVPLVGPPEFIAREKCRADESHPSVA